MSIKFNELSKITPRTKVVAIFGEVRDQEAK